jgi:hypothetical protein
MSKKNDRKKLQPLQDAVPHVPERKKKGKKEDHGPLWKSQGPPAGKKPDRSPVPPEDDLPPNPGPIFGSNNLALMTSERIATTVEPAWAKKVRESFDAAEPVGPPPMDIPPAMEDRINLDAPFVELTLVHTGQYTGPTRGRVVGEDDNGFDFLTHQGLYFVTWANLAYWTYLSEG